MSAYIGVNLAQRVKQIIIGELRYYFQVVSQFGLPGNPVAMPIVREAFALTTRQYPIIIVKILHEETKNMGIGNDFVQDVLSDDQRVGQHILPGTEGFEHPVPYRRRVIAERWGYMADITFNLQVVSDTTPVRNRVVDEVNAALRFYQRKNLLLQGIQLTRLSMGEETDFPLNLSEKIYIANLNFVVNAEMFFDQRVNSVTRVNKFVRLGFRTNPHMDLAIVQPEDDEVVEPVDFPPGPLPADES